MIMILSLFQRTKILIVQINKSSLRISLKNKKKLTSPNLLKNHLLKINIYSTLIRKQSQKIKSLQVEYQLKDTIQLYFLTKNNKFKKNQKMIKEKLKSHFR